MCRIYISVGTLPRPTKMIPLKKQRWGRRKVFLGPATKTSVTPLDKQTHMKIVEVIKELKAKEIPIFALETVEDSKVVFTPGLFPPTGCALILGNERFGIEAHILKVEMGKNLTS